MSHTLALIAVMATVTIALRFLPFLLFEKHTPGVVLYLAFNRRFIEGMTCGSVKG